MFINGIFVILQSPPSLIYMYSFLPSTKSRFWDTEMPFLISCVLALPFDVTISRIEHLDLLIG